MPILDPHMGIVNHTEAPTGKYPVLESFSYTNENNIFNFPNTPTIPIWDLHMGVVNHTDAPTGKYPVSGSVS